MTLVPLSLSFSVYIACGFANKDSVEIHSGRSFGTAFGKAFSPDLGVDLVAFSEAVSSVAPSGVGATISLPCSPQGGGWILPITSLPQVTDEKV